MVSEIYCYGGIDIYRDVFNAISMLKGDKSFIQSLMTIGVIVGAFWSMVIMVSGDLVRPFLSWLIPMTVAQTVFLSPTSTVHLIDVVQVGRHERVDHVPYGLALLAGTLSRISHQITQKTETFFTIPNDLKYSTSGGIFGANLLANQKLMAIQDEDFSENMRGFISNCVLYDVALGRKYNIKDLRNSANIWGLISSNASCARSFLWKDERNRGEIITCQEGVSRFNQAWGSVLDQTSCAVGATLYPNRDHSLKSIGGSSTGSALGAQGPQKKVCHSPLAKQEFLKFLPIHYGTMASMSGSASDILKQQMMISALVDAQDHASTLAGNSSNFAARKAYLQQRSNYETLGKLASDTLPIMRAVLELICYSLFLFIMPLLVLPQGYKVLVSWAQTILWLSMWPPVYAILHLIMVSAISMKTKSYIGISSLEGITLASSLGVQNISADMAAMAGYLSLSIPFICIAVVKGLSSFVHLSSSLGAVSQGVASGAALEGLSGNYQMGTTSLDSHSFSNTNMLNENYSGNLSSGNIRLQDGHMSLTSSAEGQMIAHIEQSQLPVSVNMAQNIANNQRIAAQEEMSLGLSKQHAFEKSLSSSLDQLSVLGETLSNSQNSQKVYGELTEQQVGKAIQTMDQAIDRLSKDAGISKAQSAQILSSVGSPQIAKTIIGLDASTNMSSENISQENISKAKEIAQQFEFDENARIAFQATEHLSKTSSQESIKSLAKNQQASLNEAAHENQSAHKHFENSKRFNKEADYTESNSTSINRNYNEKLIDYIANHQAPHVQGTLGKREALGIIAKNDDVTQAYLNRFMNEHAPRPSLSMSQDSLKQEYESMPLSQSVDRHAVDTFTQKAQGEIHHDLSTQTQGMEDRIHQKITGTDEFINKAETEVMDPRHKVLQKEHERRSTDVGIVSALKGGASAIKNAADAPLNYAGEKIEDIKDFFTQTPQKEKTSKDYKHLSKEVNTFLQNQPKQGEELKLQETQREESLITSPQEKRIFQDMNEHAPRSSFSMSHESLKHEYDAMPLSEGVDRHTVDTFPQKAQSEIHHDLSSQTQGMEDRIHKKITGTEAFINKTETEIMDPQHKALQKEHDRRSTDVGITKDIKGGAEAIQNAINAPSHIMKERWEDKKEESLMTSPQEKRTHEDDKHLSQEVNTFLKRSLKKNEGLKAQQINDIERNKNDLLSPTHNLKALLDE